MHEMRITITRLYFVFVQAKRKAGDASAPPPLEDTPDLPSPSVASSGIPRDQS